MTSGGKLPQGLLFLKYNVFWNDGGGGDGGFPRTLCIWSSPGSITPRNQISRAGIPHFDIVIKLGYKTPDETTSIEHAAQETCYW